jgi:predicted permease
MLPVKEPRQLVILTAGSWTNPIWEQSRDRRDLFNGAFAWSPNRFNLSSGGETVFADGFWASGEIFDVLGVTAMLGRTFTPADDRRGGGPDGAVAVISYNFWQRQFGGAADAIGRTLNIERVPFTIIGVTPPDFFGPDVGRSFDVAIPLGTEPLIKGRESWLDERSTWWLSIIARLKHGQSVEAANTALRAVQPQIRDATAPGWNGYLTDPFTFAPAATGDSQLRRRYERPLVIVLIIVAVVLVIACANIANLLLARATARRHEFSVRLALGASRWVLARQLLAESAVLSGLGALVGLLIARWGSRLLVRQLSTRTNRVFLDLSIDFRMLLFTVGIAAATALLFGTAPALRAAAAEPMAAIKDQGRSGAGGRRAGLTSGLVIVQVALSLMLVVAAGLFVRTFASLETFDLGFDRNRALVVTMNAQRTPIDPTDRLPTFERVLHRAQTLPGVADAALSMITPVSGQGWNTSVDVSNAPRLEGRQSMTFLNGVTPRWFATLGTRLVAGRAFTDRDRKGTSPVAVVNQAFVRRFLNGQDPIGHTVQRRPIFNRNRPGAPPEVPKEIVGVVADAVYRTLREPVPPTMYLPMDQLEDAFRPASTSLIVRAAVGPPASLARSIAAAIRDVNPDLAITFQPLADVVDASVTQERVVAMLSGFFGGLALLLAALGLYGVTSYAVNRRRTEIGIRMALGAEPAGVVGLVLRRVALLVGGGVACGALASLWTSQFVETLLWGLKPRDPVTLVAASSILAVVGVMAGWVPAWRASRIDPAAVLRES